MYEDVAVPPANSEANRISLEHLIATVLPHLGLAGASSGAVWCRFSGSRTDESIAADFGPGRATIFAQESRAYSGNGYEIASKRDCDVCALKMQCCPHIPSR